MVPHPRSLSPDASRLFDEGEAKTFGALLKSLLSEREQKKITNIAANRLLNFCVSFRIRCRRDMLSHQTPAGWHPQDEPHPHQGPHDLPHGRVATCCEIQEPTCAVRTYVLSFRTAFNLCERRRLTAWKQAGKPRSRYWLIQITSHDGWFAPNMKGIRGVINSTMNEERVVNSGGGVQVAAETRVESNSLQTQPKRHNNPGVFYFCLRIHRRS